MNGVPKPGRSAQPAIVPACCCVPIITSGRPGKFPPPAGRALYICRHKRPNGGTSEPTAERVIAQTRRNYCITHSICADRALWRTPWLAAGAFFAGLSAGAPLDTITHQDTFVVAWSANGTPTWTLMKFKGISGARLPEVHRPAKVEDRPALGRVPPLRQQVRLWLRPGVILTT